MANTITYSDVMYIFGAVSVVVGILWHFQRQINDIKVYIERKFTELELASEAAAKEQQLNVARNYASIEDLKDVEDRLSKSIESLVVSIDKLIEKLEKLSDEFRREIITRGKNGN